MENNYFGKGQLSSRLNLGGVRVFVLLNYFPKSSVAVYKVVFRVGFI